MIELKNIMEETIMERVDEVMTAMECCTCDQCKFDAASYALNRVPSRYASTESGAILSKLDIMDAQRDAEITAIVVQAVKLVKDKPHHKK